MMPGVSTKIGDVFSVKPDENNRKYFQLIAFDLTRLNSDVIRAFKRIYPNDDNPDLSDIVNGEVEFYAHCVTKWCKAGILRKSISSIGKLGHILFRGTSDYARKAGEIEYFGLEVITQ